MNMDCGANKTPAEVIKPTETEGGGGQKCADVIS